jgi:hypothetical protein
MCRAIGPGMTRHTTLGHASPSTNMNGSCHAQTRPKAVPTCLAQPICTTLMLIHVLLCSNKLRAQLSFIVYYIIPEKLLKVVGLQVVSTYT